MNKKRVLVFSAIVLLAVIVALVVKNMWTSDRIEDDFVFDRHSDIKLKDIEAYYHYIDFKEENPEDYFKDKTVTPYTIKFFMFLDENFKEFSNKEDLFDHVQKYLHSKMSAEKAGELFDLYKKFVSYQLTLGDKAREWGMPKTTEDVIGFLHKLQDYRREVFGREVADILFGASIKAEEYPLRRGAILADKNLYGAEKEKKIQQLNEDMWGEEAEQVDAYAEPYIRYKEKLDMYEKDFLEMTETEKKAQIKRFREEIFSPEQVERMEEVDKMIADSEQKESEYKAREMEILNDAGLDQKEKENRVLELQHNMYGEEADALRRRLAIERASEGALKK